ncbi:MAG: redoxin family protein [Acidimicrobiales bacterium]|jgi:cytochrome c biogenesis protein CcmG/thiol:disulfide interchange protein DsbE|nr:redoxin family protein [Acidimicrobiales bacterium]
MSETPASDRPRLALWIVIPVGVVFAAFLVLLATRDVNETGLPEFTLGGDVAPEITGITIEGEPFDLDDLRGQFVVVNFFQTTCPPCVQEHPELVSFHETYAPDGIASVISIAFNEDPAIIAEFFDTAGGDWPVLGDDTAALAVEYGVVSVPESILIAPSGEVMSKVIGGVTHPGLEGLINRWQEDNS